MSKDTEIENITKEIRRLLLELEGYFWDVYVKSGYEPVEKGKYPDYERDDKETWLFFGTRQLYYRICLFLELKNLPIYLNMFVSKFGNIIDDKKIVLKDRGPLYTESDPSMVIHDDFRDFLSGFHEFDYNTLKKPGPNKLKLILENTYTIISKTGTLAKNEPAVYKAVRWFIEIVYPQTRGLNRARFIQRFKTYHPDILVPETSSAIEYKFVKKGETAGDYLDEIKTDADNYVGDTEYKFFYAVVYFEDRTDLIQESFKNAVTEKSFPENWTIIAV